MPGQKLPNARSPWDVPGVGGATFGTLTAEAGNARTQSIQLTDGQGRALAAGTLVWVWLSDAATGLGVVAVAASSALAAGTNGKLMDSNVTGKMALFQTDTQGRLDVVITDTAARTVYLAVATQTGLKVSGAIVFA